VSDSPPSILTPVRRTAGGFRTVLFWSHLTIGLSAGALILLMSITGVMLGFERQMIAWIDGAPRLEAVPATPRLPVDSLLRRAGVSPSDLTSVALRSDPLDAVIMRFRERGRAPLALDPYTASDISVAPSGKGQAFFSALRRWHRWVGVASEEARATARTFTGAANVGFVLLALSGLFLWWPRRWTRALVRSTTVLNPRLRGKPRDFNWHNSLGFWTAIPLFLIAATGAFISYQWPGRWLDRIAGSAEEREAARRPPAAPAGGGAATAGSARPQPASASEPSTPQAPLEAFVAAAIARHPEWRSLTITVPSARDTVAQVLVAEGNTYRPDLRTTLVFDAATAAAVATRDYDSLSASRKIRAWVRFGHTGEVFGLTGQLLATLVSAAGVVLVWTGIALALRRLAAWLRRRREVSATLAPEARRVA